MNKNARRYYESALRLHLPAVAVPEIDGFYVTLGKFRYFFRGACTPFNNSSSHGVAENKYCANLLLSRAGLPVPKLTGISQAEFEDGQLEQKISGFHFPLVLKPVSEGQGHDVLCNISSLDQLQKHIVPYFSKYPFVLIEEFHADLNSYRVLVFKQKVIGVVLRYPAFVIGDGEHTLEELIPLTNEARLQTSETLSPIVVDDEVKIRLAELGVGLDYVPQLGEKVSLGYTSNATRGGSYESLGKDICPANKKMMLRAARVLNLNLVGFDVQCVDINKPIAQTAGVILEANHGPSIRIHEEPPIGPSVPVTQMMVRTLIYKHPLAYLRLVFRRAYQVVYVRVMMILAILGISFKYLL